MRNVIIHDYPGMDLRIVWDTARCTLPPEARQSAKPRDGDGS